MSSALQLIERCKSVVRETEPIKVYGKVSRGIGILIEGLGPHASIGDICQIESNVAGAEQVIEAEVVGFKEDKILLMPLGELRGIGPGSRIVAKGRQRYIRVGSGLLGRILDGIGNPIDAKEPITGELFPVYNEPINPLYRQRITTPLDLGIRSLNTILTCGKGQRIGIMAGSGVGKSVLLGMMARHTAADVNVIALIG